MTGFHVPPPPTIVDASVAVDLAIGEREDLPAAVAGWIEEGRLLLAPAVAWSEIGHVLLRRLDRDPIRAARRLEQLEATGLEIADRGPAGVRMAVAVAARHGLSVYDASYLWLAMDIDGELATFDQDLARAARAEGVPLALEA